jgi:DNA-binding NarL/FixJ family response regulator
VADSPVRALVVATPATLDALRRQVEGDGILVSAAADAFDRSAAADADVVVVDDASAAGLAAAFLAEGVPRRVGVLVIGDGGETARDRFHGRPKATLPAGTEARVVRAAVAALAAGLSVSLATGRPLAPPTGTLSVPRAQDADVDEPPPEPLTTREREVLDAVAEGLSNRAIAERLGISDHTVKFHLASIFGKLGVTTRAGAVRRALRRGVIDL